MAGGRVTKKWAGKWALVTGASAGIGMEMARQLALAKVNVVLTARRAERLKTMAEEFVSRNGVRAKICVADLTRPEAPGQIFAFTQDRGIPIELLVNNAGFGAFGYVHKVPAQRSAEMIQVNCTAVVALTQLFVPQMIERQRGDILIVSSVAAFQPVPFNSTYAATKAFDLIFAGGITEELRAFGVHVCALCPGSTTSEFQTVAEQPDRVFRTPETAEKVARAGLEAMARGKALVIPGAKNWLMVEAERVAPRRFVARMAAKMMRPANT